MGIQMVSGPLGRNSGVRTADGLSVLLNDSCGDAGHHSVGRNILQNDSAGADDGTIADFDRAKHFGSDSNEDIVTDNGDLVVAAAAADRDMLGNHAVVSDDNSSMNDGAQTPVIEINIAADSSHVMNGSRKHKPHEVMDCFGQQRHLPSV